MSEEERCLFEDIQRDFIAAQDALERARDGLSVQRFCECKVSYAQGQLFQANKKIIRILETMNEQIRASSETVILCDTPTIGEKT
jgi:uncharacterized protein YukE